MNTFKTWLPIAKGFAKLGQAIRSKFRYESEVQDINTARQCLLSDDIQYE